MATDQVLEATARAITYYLDVSQECTRRIVACEGTIRAICSRLLVIEVADKTSRDLAEQCIKSLELICARESAAVFEAGGLACILPFILEHGSVIHKDTLHSAMSVVTRLCARVEPSSDQSLEFCVETLSKLLRHEDAFVADGALRCFASLSDRFARKGADPAPLAQYGLVDELIQKLADSIAFSVQTNSTTNNTGNNSNSGVNSKSPTSNNTPQTQQPTDFNKSLSASLSSSSSNVVSISTLTSLLSTLCRSSDTIFREITKPKNVTLLDSVEKGCSSISANNAGGQDERCMLDIMRFLDLLITLIYEGRQALSVKTSNQPQNNTKAAQNKPAITAPNESNKVNKNSVSESNLKDKTNSAQLEKLHRQLIEWIRIKDTESFIDALESSSSSSLDALINSMDDVGQTLLNWAAAFGTPEQVEYLVGARGADPNKGARSSSLHYAACFGRAQIVRILLAHGANPDLRDEEGRTALEKARERGEDSHRECVQILQQTSLLSENNLVLNATSEKIISNDDEQNQASKVDNTAANETNSQQTNQTYDISKTSIIIEQTDIEKLKVEESQEQRDLVETKLVYAKRLIPIFARLYLSSSSMIPSISKSCLNLLRKLVNYATKEQFQQVLRVTNENDSTSTLLVEVISKILQEQEDQVFTIDNENEDVSEIDLSQNANNTTNGINYEAIYIALTISNDLFTKCSPFIVEEFTRFGVSNLITQFAQANLNDESSRKSKLLAEIELNQVYRWDGTSPTSNWALMYTKDFIYIWQPLCAIELSHKSNGWFRFMLNDKLYSMYSNGKPEVNDAEQITEANTTEDSASLSAEENKQLFINRFLKAKEFVLKTQQPILSLFVDASNTSGQQETRVENWLFRIVSSNEDSNKMGLEIRNMHTNTQRTILKPSLNGIEFESNKNELTQFVGLVNHGATFEVPVIAPVVQVQTTNRFSLFDNVQNASPPASAVVNKLSALQHYLAVTTAKTARLKLKQLKLSIVKLAIRLNDEFLKPRDGADQANNSQNRNKPRDLALKLIELVQQTRDLYKQHEELTDEIDDSIISEKLSECFINLKSLLTVNDQGAGLSSYEISISGLVQILLMVLTKSKSEKKLAKRVELFVSVFILSSSNQQNSSVLLRKLVTLLESIEKLPLYLYDVGTYNLQAFSKRFKLILNKGEEDLAEGNLLDFSGRVLKVEPLANISHLEKYIGKMVVKQWFDYPRKSLFYLTKLKERLENGECVELKYEKDFDENGLLYWIGTNGKTRQEWMNPVVATNNSLLRLSISESSRQQMSSGKLEDVIGRTAVACHTGGEDKRVWIVLDLGLYIIPTHYTLRYSKGFSKTAPRNWALLASRTGDSTSADWDLLSVHSNDDTLKEFGSSHTW
jgi:E3 ubiquitin-protein ligase HECTD1